MEVTLPLAQMSTAEKLRVMETLWADLSRNEEKFESPEWHEGVLREREKNFQSGQEKPMDWETAKASLRNLRPNSEKMEAR